MITAWNRLKLGAFLIGVSVLVALIIILTGIAWLR